MRTLPKLVSRTEVGKTVELEIWRDKKLITKKLTLGRLESSEDFKAENKPINPKKEESEIEVLKITVRDVSPQDIESRKLDKKTEGVVILEIGNKSPLAGLLQAGDIILEVQKNKVSSADDLNKQIETINKKGEQTLLLTIINNNNQRRYLGVKIN
jgi:serine protease Do